MAPECGLVVGGLGLSPTTIGASLSCSVPLDFGVSNRGANKDAYSRPLPGVPNVPVGTCRWGEARHPGPGPLLNVGFSNPNGLRQKETAAVMLGHGIWSFAETQLSSVTQKTCASQLRFQAQCQHRQLRVHLGAPVAFRSNSDWAGSWSGVATISDLPSQEVGLPYTEERSCGRVLTTRHACGVASLLNTVVYGFPKGPTWPQAKALNEQLLQVITTEVVLGGVGPRIVGGDFNTDPCGLDTFALWKRLGWISAQELAFRAWGQEPSYTCKGSTERDIVWLSPEAAACCQMVDVADVFAEHSTVTVGLDLLLGCSPHLGWPRPSPIPWNSVDPNWTSTAIPPAWTSSTDSNAMWGEWGSSLESSLDGYVRQQPGNRLQPPQRGRLQRMAPVVCSATKSIPKPSRPSEVVLRNDLIGSEVKLWFRQLRRLQSYLAGIRGGKMSVDAVTYRLELWSSVLRSPGFRGGFATWWTSSRLISFPDSHDGSCLASWPGPC